MNKSLVVVRGGGDMATGTIHRLWAVGLQVVVLEVERPSAIRRPVAFSEAIYQCEAVVEGATAVHVSSLHQIEEIHSQGKIPILIDPQGEIIAALKPFAVVDAILAKRNLGTRRAMAPLTVALGPGFVAGQDVDVVIETMRGHNLARIIRQGSALANTGIPGEIKGITAQRVLHASCAGWLENKSAIGDLVEQGQTIAMIHSDEGTVAVTATISGVLRGLIRDGYPVTQGFKIADIDPRIGEQNNCFTISDKARAIGGGVLEVIMTHMIREGLHG